MSEYSESECTFQQQALKLRLNIAMTVEEAYLQWVDGYLDEELWLNRKNHAFWWLGQRRVRKHWDDWQGRGWFTDQFMAAMNAELETI